MMKQYKKELIVSTLLALLPIAAGLLLWNRLPGQLATHWGMHGADRWSGKAAAVFLQPLLLLAAHYLVLFLVFRDAKNRNQSKKVVGLLFWMIPAVSILVSGITYAVALGWKFRLAGLLYVGLGLMFAAIGNYFPKCRPNRTVGIRISWTLGSEENWSATHRFAGKVWVIGGLIMVLAALLPEVPGIIVTILAAAALSILPIAYSYRYHRIHGTKSEPDPLSKKISGGVRRGHAVHRQSPLPVRQRQLHRGSLLFRRPHRKIRCHRRHRIPGGQRGRHPNLRRGQLPAAAGNV